MLDRSLTLWRPHEDLDLPLSNAADAFRFRRIRDQFALSPNAHHYGFVVAGTCNLAGPSGTFSLQPEMYFSVPGPATVDSQGHESHIVLMSHDQAHELFQLGGPAEKLGRLRYIDGCSDSLLIAPILKGRPCLNLLYVPPGVDQTAHTHPSFRAGVVIGGHGVCRTAESEFALQPGCAFVIQQDAVHSFHTLGEHLRVIAFHPDGDFGPTNDDHPMLNRTIVNGQSASQRRILTS